MITKSYKDYRVLRNLGVNVTWFQNEGAFPDNLDDIINDYKDVIVFFDNDFTGLAASETCKYYWRKGKRYTSTYTTLRRRYKRCF